MKKLLLLQNPCFWACIGV